MSIPSRRAALLSLAVTVTAYASGIVVAGALAVYAAQRIGTAVLEQLATPAQLRHSELAAASPAAPGPLAPASILGRESAMTPLQERWEGRSRPGWPGAGPQFGGSSRNVSRWPSPFGGRPWGFGDDEDGERPAAGTFRSVCVRLCDGYYFPVSFAVSPDRLQRDSRVCASRCGAQGRLFVHRNPGGTVEDMADLQGRSYRQLRTAFLYRTEYVPSCTCQPHPWEVASLDRHRAYALAREATKGNRDALKELQALRAKQRQEGAPNPVGVAATPPPDAGSTTAALPRRDGEDLMRLGGSETPKSGPQRAPSSTRSDPDWVRRVFGAGAR